MHFRMHKIPSSVEKVLAGKFNKENVFKENKKYTYKKKRKQIYFT